VPAQTAVRLADMCVAGSCAGDDEGKREEQHGAGWRIPHSALRFDVRPPFSCRYIHTYVIHTLYIHTYIHYTYIHTLYIHTYIIHTYIHYTYIHTLYIHTYIHTDIQTYRHTYIHTCAGVSCRGLTEPTSIFPLLLVASRLLPATAQVCRYVWRVETLVRALG